MGMDIFGLNPKLTEKKPEIEFENSTEEERTAYWQKMDEWKEANPGCYFRANLWSWRVINKIINLVNVDFKLNLDVEGFGSNSGNGLNNHEDCNELADAMERYLQINNDFKSSEIMYLNLGMWVADDNTFNVNQEIENQLNDKFPVGTILYSSVVTENGLVKPAWGTSIKHVRKFIEFLRNCNGFEIH
jgi:hypothetical protein